MITLVIFLLVFAPTTFGLILTAPESAPPGHIVGYVEGKAQLGSEPRYLVVFPDRNAEKVSVFRSKFPSSFFLVERERTLGGSFFHFCPASSGQPRPDNPQNS